MITAERELKPLVLNPPPNITFVVDDKGVDDLITFLESNSELGFDIETTPTKDFYWRRIRTMQFGNNSKQYVIDLKAFCNNDSELLYSCQGEYGKNLSTAPMLNSLLQKLSKYLVSKTYIKVGVNLSFEYECLYWLFGIRASGWYDCMLAEKCIYAGLGGYASLKRYEFYSMESMMNRYFGVSIDKTLQTSFNLEDELTSEQIEYAALDTRTPIAIKTIQSIIANGETVDSLKKKGKTKLADYLYYVDRRILGDNLNEVIQIENNALGAFVDMHVHGERLDVYRWVSRVNKAKEKLKDVVKGLDVYFVPIVGSKHEAVNDAVIEQLEAEWKNLTTISEEELAIKNQLRELKKKGVVFLPETPLQLNIQLLQLEVDRKEKKEIIKKKCNDLKKLRTKINKLKDKCEGEALINYSSDAQLLHCLRDNFPKLNKLESLDDETLEKYENVGPIKLIREYHGLSKEVGTYGMTWVQKWTTHPCAAEGWMHPGDERIHSEFNQYDAETGRSSSEKPNGQNLPQDKEVRSSFIADPPNEDIRISDCCDADSYIEDIRNGEVLEVCKNCLKTCTTHAEEYVIVTSDMSGAELRIMADDSGDEQWVGAFERGEDLHSSGTELLYAEEWVREALSDCLYYVVHDEESVKKYPKAIVGTPKKEKCNCPLHKERRNATKACNFLLAYGGGPSTLASNIGKSLKESKALMELHEQKNPGIWKYLKESGEKAEREYKAFDLYGRRRILPEPTWDNAIDNCKEYNEKYLRLPDEDCSRNIQTFINIKGRKPNQTEEFELTHRQPTNQEISRSLYQLRNGIARKGKNHRIQGTNASIAKIAMGDGFDEYGKPFLWHTFPLYKAKLIKFVHDELVVQCPKQHANTVAQLIGDAFKRAAAIKMKKVVMEFDFSIANYWKK